MKKILTCKKDLLDVASLICNELINFPERLLDLSGTCWSKALLPPAMKKQHEDIAFPILSRYFFDLITNFIDKIPFNNSSRLMNVWTYAASKDSQYIYSQMIWRSFEGAISHNNFGMLDVVQAMSTKAFNEINPLFTGGRVHWTPSTFFLKRFIWRSK